MKKKIKYTKNPHQKDFHEDLVSKYLHMSSGFGGGKSYALVMKGLQLSMLNRPFAGGIVAPTYKEFKKDIFPIFEDIFERNHLELDYHKTDLYFNLPWTRGKLYVFSGETKIRGPNLAYMLLNESTLMKASTYREAIGRVRVKGAKCPQIASVGTPEGIGNYMYEMLVENPMPGSRIVYGNTIDNQANLDPGYIQSLERSFDKKMLEAYLKGLWVNMNGQSFYYAFDPAKNEDRTIKRIPGQEVHCFMDFNVEYMTATFWHYDGKSLKGFDEIVLENNADTEKMCAAMRARDYLPDDTFIYPDPAGRARSTKGQPDHEILRRCGYFNIRARSSQPRMRQRQLNVNNLLEKSLIKFNPDVLRTLRKDLQAVEQDPITMEKSKDNPKLTHASDGLDYGCDILFEFSGSRKPSEVLKFR